MKSSTLAQIWIKHDRGQAVQVSTAGCVNLSDLAEAIKSKLSPKLYSISVDEITVLKTAKYTALCHSLLVADLLDTVPMNTHS
jgi:hypothetical protein